MRLGFRGKFLLLALVLVAVVDLAAGIYLEIDLRGELQHSMEAELTRHALTVRDLVELARPTQATADRVADRAGESAGARVTLMTADGQVVGDSELSPAQVERVENHGNRPEVREALQGRRGLSIRHSATLDQSMLYVAIPSHVEDGPAVVRLALPLQRIEDAVTRLRVAMAIAGMVGIALAAILLTIVSVFVSRALESVLTAAHTVPKTAAPSTAREAQETAPESVNALASELKRAMTMLSAERNRFETVLQTMDGAVLALDSSERVTTVNRAAGALLGLDENVEGRTLLEAVRIPGIKQLVDATRGEGSNRAEFDIAGGKRVQARATLQSDGGIVIVILDMTEIRRLERIRRDFVANVSHELRTPISVIQANTETLLSGALDDPTRARQFTEASMRHAERLGRLVSDLLDISRIEAGQYKLDACAASVAEAVVHVFEAMEDEAERKQLEFGVDLEPDLFVLADIKALDQVLINLVGNALKYTPAGGEVEVAACARDGQVRIEVRDDGPGIDPRHRARIFERFYRVDPGRSRDMGGTGLGLSISKHLVEAMGGKLGLDPRSPRGSVFWLVLPAASRPLERRPPPA